MWIPRGLYEALPMLYAAFATAAILLSGFDGKVLFFSAMLYLAVWKIVKMRTHYRSNVWTLN